MIPFKQITSFFQAERVPFSTWMDNAQKLSSQGDAIATGLLLFESGLPDDRKYRKEIAERGRLLGKYFGEAVAWSCGFESYLAQL